MGKRKTSVCPDAELCSTFTAMKLVVIRHGAAMDKDEFAQTGKSDDLRPLTPEGETQMRDIAAGLRVEVKKIDVLATSPLVRARQTADIVAAAYGIKKCEITNSLIGDAQFEDFEKWCFKYRDKKVVAVVGHEPHLSGLVTWFLTGRHGERIRLKKGGVCMLVFDSEAQRDSGMLHWLMMPRHLTQSAKVRSTE